MRNHPARTSLLVVALAVAMCAGGSATAAAQPNLIQIENAKAGSSDWLLTKVTRHDDEIYELGWHRRKGIEAYASHTSVKAGETLTVHVSTRRDDPRIQRITKNILDRMINTKIAD